MDDFWDAPERVWAAQVRCIECRKEVPMERREFGPKIVSSAVLCDECYAQQRRLLFEAGVL